MLENRKGTRSIYFVYQQTLKNSVYDNLHRVSGVGNGFTPKLLLPTL